MSCGAEINYVAQYIYNFFFLNITLSVGLYRFLKVQFVIVIFRMCFNDPKNIFFFTYVLQMKA